MISLINQDGSCQVVTGTPHAASFNIDLEDLPATKDDLIVALLRHANDISRFLNEIHGEVIEADQRGERSSVPLDLLLRKRFGPLSSIPLFVAADQLEAEGVLTLPDDLKCPDDGEATENYDGEFDE